MGKKKADSLGDRMKQNYEYVPRTYLTRRVPVIIRLDGKAFHNGLQAWFLLLSRNGDGTQT